MTSLELISDTCHCGGNKPNPSRSFPFLGKVCMVETWMIKTLVPWLSMTDNWLTAQLTRMEIVVCSQVTSMPFRGSLLVSPIIEYTVTWYSVRGVRPPSNTLLVELSTTSWKTDRMLFRTVLYNTLKLIKTTYVNRLFLYLWWGFPDSFLINIWGVIFVLYLWAAAFVQPWLPVLPAGGA